MYPANIKQEVSRMILTFDNVSKHYDSKHGRTTVMQDVSFTIEKGINFGVLGMNGAGKSTTLKMIAGSQLPSKGKIKRFAKFSWPLGFAGSFNGSLSGEENLRFACRVYDVPIKKTLEYVHDFTELGEKLKHPIKTYSSGMLQKLAYGLSMAIDFDVYLIDETLSVGDANFRKKCDQVFQEKAQKSNLIIVSHQIETIKQYSDKILLIHKGGAKIYDDLDQAISIYQTLEP